MIWSKQNIWMTNKSIGKQICYVYQTHTQQIKGDYEKIKKKVKTKTSMQLLLNHFETTVLVVSVQ